MEAVFGDFAEIKPVVWAIICLIAVGAGVLLMCRKKWNTRMLTDGAVAVALSFILSCIKLYEMPQGGSLTPGSMLPVMLFAYIYGAGPGIAVGTVFGLLNLLQGFYIVHPLSLLMDYVFAFATLGLAGLAKKRLYVGILYGGAGRLFWHILSGYIFFSAYAWDGWNPLLYAVVYNVITVMPDTIICVLLSLIPSVKRLADKRKATAKR